MNLLSGTKDKLALEYVESEDDKALGRLFLYVNGRRFGEDCYDFEADAMIESTLDNFKVYGLNLAGLADCPTEELFDSYEKMSSFDEEEEDIKELGEIAAIKYFPNFVERFVDVDDCVFRYVHYAFDGISIILIPAGKKLKLYIRDDNSKFCTEVMTTADEFLGLWKEMGVKRVIKGVGAL